jgi:glycosyltransferase involved in cell wall biosynthesis
VHGVAISTELVLNNAMLRDRFAVLHLDTSDPRPIDRLGRWDVTNIRLGLKNWWTFGKMLGGGRGVVYLPLSQNIAAFVRDSLLIWTASLRGWRVALHFRGGDFPAFYLSRRLLTRLWIRVSLRRATSIAVLGQELISQFDGVVAPSRIVVMPNGSPDALLSGTKRDRNTVLYLGNLMRRKGVGEAVEAAILALEAVPAATFLFVGDWEDQRLEEEITRRARPYEPRICFEPSIDSSGKKALLSSAGVLLFTPVLPEGHPRAVLEAMSAGLAIVTTARGAISETVVDEYAGFVLDDPIPREIAKCLVRLLDDPQLRDRMGGAARDRFLTHYTQDEADRRLADWLTKVKA